MSRLYPQGAQRQAQGSSRIVSIPAPVGGWNTRDRIDGMNPLDALRLDNAFPEIDRIRMRGGYEDYATGLGSDDVETLISFTSGSAAKFLAAANGKVYDISTSGAGDATDWNALVSGGWNSSSDASSDRWQWVVFADASAPDTPTVLAVNGTDPGFKYDTTSGGTFADFVFEKDDGTGSATAATESEFIWINVFKNRVFLGKANSRNFFYGKLGKIPNTGTSAMVTEFPLEGIRGAQGNVLFMATMTRDTGSGPDDYAVFVTSEGQAIVYAGTDPGDATKWSLLGVYQIPRPINSRRAWAPIFGDVVIATELDYVFLSQSIQQGGSVNLTPSKLTGAMQAAAAQNKDNYGWQIVAWPEGNKLISNVPLDTNAIYHQHVINVQSRSPCRYTGWNMRCLGTHNGKLYGGGSGEVYELDVGFSDDASGDENPIQLRMQTAWLDLSSPEIKRIRAVRPFFQTITEVDIATAIGVDFVAPEVTAPTSIGTGVAETLWGDTAGATTLWGDTAATETYWAGGATAALSANRKWRLLGGRGTDFSLYLAGDLVDHRLEWISTDYKLDASQRF